MSMSKEEVKQTVEEERLANESKEIKESNEASHSVVESRGHLRRPQGLSSVIELFGKFQNVMDGKVNELTAQNKAEINLIAERSRIATEVMDHIRGKVLTLGSAEALKGEKAWEKISTVLTQYLPYDTRDKSLASIKLAIDEALVQISKANIFVELTDAEKDQAKAMISIFLINRLCADKLSKLDLGYGVCLENIARTNHIYELAKTGTSTPYANLMISYLLKNHRDNPAIYPLKVYKVHQRIGWVSPYHHYQVVLLGSGDGQVVCDAVRGQVYPYNEYPKFAPEVLGDLEFEFTDEANDWTFSVKSPKDETIANFPILAIADKEDLGISPVEMDKWVEGFYRALTAPHADASFLPGFLAASAAGSASAAASAAAPSSGAASDDSETAALLEPMRVLKLGSAPADSEMAPLLEPEAQKAEPQVRKRSGWFSGWF